MRLTTDSIYPMDTHGSDSAALSSASTQRALPPTVDYSISTSNSRVTVSSHGAPMPVGLYTVLASRIGAAFLRAAAGLHGEVLLIVRWTLAGACAYL